MTTGWSQRRCGTATARRRLAAFVSAALIFPLAGTAARADCQTDISGLMKKRLDAIAAISKAKTKEGKLDPIPACPRLRSLASIESEVTAYMTKNQEWCNLPPDFVQNMTTSFKRTSTVATQACTFAVKIKQMQQQQAQQQQEAAPKLPTGPL